MEALGTTQSLQAPGPPIDLGQQGDALGQLVAEPGTGPQVGVEGGGPGVAAHRRPAIDEPHQVEGPSQHRGVLADGHGGGVGHLGPVQGLDDAPLAQDALITVGRRLRWRDADHTAGLTPADLVDVVLGTTGQDAVLDGLALARQPLPVHPGGQPLEVDHRFPSSSSMYSANLALAASSFPGIHSDGHMPSAGW